MPSWHPQTVASDPAVVFTHSNPSGPPGNTGQSNCEVFRSGFPRQAVGCPTAFCHRLSPNTALREVRVSRPRFQPVFRHWRAGIKWVLTPPKQRGTRSGASPPRTHDFGPENRVRPQQEAQQANDMPKCRVYPNMLGSQEEKPNISCSIHETWVISPESIAYRVRKSCPAQYLGVDHCRIAV